MLWLACVASPADRLNEYARLSFKENDSYQSKNEFYYPEEENVLQENKNIVNTSNDSSAVEEMSTIQDFIEAQRPENTTKKTAYDINVWKRFCLSIGEVRELENIPTGNLNVLLCKFFMDMKKKDGVVCRSKEA